jgi:hypothetical protein
MIERRGLPGLTPLRPPRPSASPARPAPRARRSSRDQALALDYARHGNGAGAGLGCAYQTCVGACAFDLPIPRLTRGDPPRLMRSFLAHFLILLAAWTVTIKFLFPVAFALAEGAPLTRYIYWDFWWVIHLWLAWALLRRPPYTTALALGCR